MKQSYMARLERWARWMLPRPEAEDVIADYREITADPELLRGLDKPRNVIRPLVQKKQYDIWLAVFAVMAACVLAVGFCPSALGYPIWMGLVARWDYQPHWLIVLAVLGAAATLIWFRLYGQREGRLSRAIPVLLAVCLLYIAGVLLFLGACARDLEGFLAAWGRIDSFIGPNTDVSRSFYLSRVVICESAPLLAIVGAVALIKARMGDCRWTAVYVLAMAAALTGLLALVWTVDTGWTADAGAQEQFRQMLVRASVTAAVGLAGTGVALL